MKYANWNVPERGAEIPRALLAAGCTPLLAAILHLRGLSDPAAARSFLRGGAETLTNPLELTGMVDAVQRLTRAVATGEHVAVYGDYDVDGISATAIAMELALVRGAHVRYFIPHRFNQGYGLHKEVATTIAKRGCDLVFLEKYNFSDKKIILFATSGGSGFGNTMRELQPSVPNSVIEEGRIFNYTTRQQIIKWVETL